MSNRPEIPDLSITEGDILTDYATCSVRVERIFTRGGFGLVVAGPDEMRGGQRIALKTLKPTLLRQPDIYESFVREALNWVGLWPHMNVVRALGLTEIQHVPFLQLTYAEHGTLRDLMQRGTPQLETGLSLAQMIAAGLTYLHSPDPRSPRPQPLDPQVRDPQPMIHRDLKPENILLFGPGLFQITDFGLAKAFKGNVRKGTVAGSRGPAPSDGPSQTLAAGTARYMAPEQWVDSSSVGPEADLFAFGIILYEIFTGGYPFQVDTGASPTAILKTRPESLRLARTGAQARRLDDLYRHCLSPEPRKRPSAAEALRTLQQIARDLGEEPYVVTERTPRTPENECGFWANLAATCGGLKLYDRTVEYSDRALAINPTQAASLLARAIALQELGRPGESLETYSRALAALPADDTMHCGLVHYNRTVLLMDAERHAEAETAAALACRLTPSNADLWFNRAQNLRAWALQSTRSGDTDAAYTQTQRALLCVQEALALKPYWSEGQNLLRELRLIESRFKRIDNEL